jgi:DNA-binding NtrC family response regulator
MIMRTHIDRLPEYYEQKYKQKFEDLDWDWIKVISAKKRLLVIDDEPNFRNAYSRIFFNDGFEVLSAANATDANDILVKEKIDIVLLDINMAEVDGSVLFDVMKTFHRDVKVVVSSVYPIDEQKERIRSADAYFDKSDGKDVLLGIISTLLDGHTTY